MMVYIFIFVCVDTVLLVLIFINVLLIDHLLFWFYWYNQNNFARSSGKEFYDKSLGYRPVHNC